MTREIKTRPTAQHVDEFLSAVTPGKRRWPRTGFSPRKAHLSICALKELPGGAALLPRLGAFTEGAGRVCVRKLEDIDLDVLRELIAIAWTRA